MSDESRLHPPEAVLEINRELEHAGFEVWCVGGAVRDALLGHQHLDWDLATNATPDQVREIFGRKRTVPVGIEFGTVGVLDRDRVLHEVTTFREDVRTDGRHAEVEFGASLEEDLARRDFTINAIAFSPTRDEIRDPFGGKGDLHARVIRAVGDPHVRMREDRLRALRGIRFASRFQFRIDPPTWQAIRDSAPQLTRLSAERVKQELEKTLDQVRAPSGAIRLWSEAGALQQLIPELGQPTDELLLALDCAAQPGPSRRPGRRLNRFAVLFSDCGADHALATASRLRFSRHDAQWIALLVDRWRELGTPMVEQLVADVPSPAAVRRWVARIGRLHLGAFFRLAAARWSGVRGMGRQGEVPAARAVHLLYKRCMQAALSDPIELRDLRIDGDDLRRVGIASGPQLGKILAALLELVLEDPGKNTPDSLLMEARRLHGS